MSEPVVSVAPESIDVEMKVSVDSTAAASALPEDSDLTKIEATRQIEFYFADSNLPYDKFMWTLHTKSPDHWVPLGTIASFKRMKPYLSLGLPWLIEAIKEKSTLLELDEKDENIRRSTEVKEPVGAFDRSVYAKGFPEEDPTLQSKIEKFFSQYGTINQVRMRREDPSKVFKKSVFAEFSDLKDATAFLKTDPKPTYDGQELLTMSKDAYVKMKCKEKGITGKDAKKRREGPPRSFNAFAEMKKDKSRSAQGGTAVPNEVFLEFMGNKVKIHTVPKNRDATETSSDVPQGLYPGDGYVIPSEVPITSGATLQFTFNEPVADVMWKDLKNPLKALIDNRAPFTKFEKGEKCGLVSFHRKLEESEIEKVKATLPSLSGNAIEWSQANADDEKAFQIERAQNAAKSALGSSGGGSSNRGGARGGRGGGRRGGRGGSRGGRGRGGFTGNRNAEKKESEDADVGDKRKRAIEPDGGPDVGLRGVGIPPAIASSTREENTSKKTKVDTDAS